MREKLKSGFRRFSIRIFSHLGTGTKIAVIGHERHTSQCCRWYLGRSEENRRTTLPLLGPRHFLARRLSKRYGLAVVSDWGNERRMAKKGMLKMDKMVRLKYLRRLTANYSVVHGKTEMNL